MEVKKVRILKEDDELPPTLTPKELNLEDEGSVPTKVMPWGRLISQQFYLKSVDLIEPFSFGRGEDCSVVLTHNNCESKVLSAISKKHFEIYKCEEDGLIYIQDYSKNGTFVNEELLGLKQRKILKSSDKIACSLPKFSMYTFLKQGPEDDDFLPRQLIDRFVNLRKLGQGSCGDVRLVKDRKTFKEYAMKKINLSASNSSLMNRINHPSKIYNEITILRSLCHPCVIGMSDIVQVDKTVYLILEYMKGGELTNRILKRPMSEDLAKFYFIQIIFATHYLHLNGIIHRDLKPQNILLLDHREETLLKITDFGLSKDIHDDNAITMCGTLQYVAPEVLNARFRDYGEYGKEVDIWSLGVILFYMISQDFPFRGEDDVSLARSIVKGNFDFSNKIWLGRDVRLRHLINQMLIVDPKKRIGIGQIMDHSCMKFEHGLKRRVKKLFEEHGLDNPMEELSLEPSPKKFKFGTISSSSSDESNSTLTDVGKGLCSCSPTICC